MIDGKQFVQEGLKSSAYQVLQAYYKAPQATSRVKLQSMVLNAEDMQPMFDVIESVEKSLGKEAMTNLFMPMYMDYLCYKDTIEQGNPPMVLVLGADLTKSELGWDCGGCGFPTCNDFNRYSKESGSMGVMGRGPSCVWKTIDYSIAVDYACAAAWQLNIENRIQGTFGALAFMLGYLDNASMVLTLPLIPAVELWFYNRPSMPKMATWQELSYLYRKNYSIMFQMFSSNANPWVKDDGEWWQKEPHERDIGMVFHSPELEDLMLNTRAELMQVVIEKNMEVDAIKAKKLKQESTD